MVRASEVAPTFTPDATLLVPRFTIQSGAAATNSTQVRIGDRGYSPYFRPGMLVWDGGSIIGGAGSTAGMDVARQTMRLIPRACRSRESVSGNALIKDMVAEAEAEVDTWFDSRADVDACIAMPGSADLRAGRTPAGVYRDVVTYCRARRAKGFSVVVVTLLPRTTPAAFEQLRQRYNRLLRENWVSFCDGLADVAADGRIGDCGDNLDRTYYRKDGVHLTDAGYGVMASVVAPVLSAFVWRSSSCEMRFLCLDGTWTEWRPHAPAFDWHLASGDGVKTVIAEYREGGGPAFAVSDDIFLDTARPNTVAPDRAIGRRGTVVTLACRVNDPLPSCGSADLRIKLATLAGHLVKTFRRADRPTNTWLSVSFRVPYTCADHAYRFSVYADDAAGNEQVAVGSNELRLR
ncbi:MAG: hypothetical protein V2J16_10720 [Thermoleophilia bacterium]|nr:hypothetical protein [Thermoleophilia bacterium]